MLKKYAGKAKILNRLQVVDTLKQIIEEADNEIWLISPYVKLNTLLRNALSKHKDKKDFKLVIVYGKNDEDKRMSLSDNDLAFFKSFSQVEIRYNKSLHAKMYANDFDLLITSMNLHTYSMNENIEVGIVLKMNSLRDFGNMLGGFVGDSLEAQARALANEIINNSEIYFQKTNKKHSSLFGLFSTHHEPTITVNKQRTGFCIRTHEVIPYNLGHPYCEKAFPSWSQYKNLHYKERYCHACGKATE